jgi:5'-AMP-activated protein kinase catalytic alpha subunit
MIAGKRYHGSNVDIWSCGVILFALICGYLPFEDPNTTNLYKKILNGDFSIPRFVSPEGKELIAKVLNTDPETRFKADDIRKHKWYNLVTPPKKNEGLIIGFNQIPVDKNVLAMLEQYGFRQDFAEKCLNANKHNHVTTTYYLLLKRYQRLGGTDISSLSARGPVATAKSFSATQRVPVANSTTTPQSARGEILNQTMPAPIKIPNNNAPPSALINELSEK